MTRLRNEKDMFQTGKRGGILNGFRRDEEGSLIIFGLFLFILMLMIGGLGVDLMRYEAQRARLQATLDRAVLAAASMSQPLPPKLVVMDYFQKAGLGGLITEDDITVEDFSTYRRVAADVSMVVDSTFLNFMGIDHLNAPGYGAAEESASQTEISLVVDVSGSMGNSSSSGNSKIYELRSAAKQFVNILQCDPADGTKTTDCTVEAGKVSISLIPYSEQVVAGAALLDSFQILNSYNPVTREHTSSHCIHWEEEDFEVTSLDLLDPTLVLQRTGHFDPWRSWDRTPSNWTCKLEDWREILPYGYSHAALRSQIDRLNASGYTSIDLGMKWGALLLDPSLQRSLDNLIADGEVNAAFDDRPFAYSERGISKVVVLMTDGQNTTQHYLHDGNRSGLSPIWHNDMGTPTRLDDDEFSVYRASTEQYYRESNDAWLDHPYGNGESSQQVCSGRRWWRTCTWQISTEPGTAVQLTFPQLWTMKTWDWYDWFSWLDAGSSHDTSTKDTRLDAICTAAKDQGITIFTVGFETSDRSNGVMANCASSLAHHFDADGTNLTEAFAAIAREISKLRLVN